MQREKFEKLLLTNYENGDRFFAASIKNILSMNKRPFFAKTRSKNSLPCYYLAASAAIRANLLSWSKNITKTMKFIDRKSWLFFFTIDIVRQWEKKISNSSNFGPTETYDHSMMSFSNILEHLVKSETFFNAIWRSYFLGHTKWHYHYMIHSELMGESEFEKVKTTLSMKNLHSNSNSGGERFFDQRATLHCNELFRVLQKREKTWKNRILTLAN